jgi:molybdopterin converting factor subunit 1
LKPPIFTTTVQSMPQIEINVRFFGPAREWTGQDDMKLAVPTAATLGAVAGVLSEKYPRLGQAVGVRLALNQAFVPLSASVKAGDEVAVIPPVSGG